MQGLNAILNTPTTPTKNEPSSNSKDSDFLATLLDSIKQGDKAKEEAKIQDTKQAKASSQDNNEIKNETKNEIKSKTQKKDKNEIKSQAKDEIKNEAKPKEVKETTNTKFEEIKDDIKEENLHKNTLVDNANFMQLLGLLEALNGGQKISKFPNFSDQLAKFLSVEKNINELKGAKSLQDLIKLANKFDLGISKIKITKEDLKGLKEEFKTLNDNDFFKFDEVVLDEITKKKIEKSLNSQKKNEEPNLSKILQNINTTNIQKDKNTSPKIASTSPKENKLNLKEEKISPKETQTNIINQTSKPLNKLDETLNLKSSPVEKSVSKSSPKDEKTKPVNKLDEILTQKDEPQEIKPSLSKTIPKTNKHISIDDYLSNISKLARKEQSKEQISTTLKSEISPNIETTSPKSTETTSGENSNNESQNSFVKDIVSNAKLQLKSTQIKQTFESFASNLQEKIAEYKPPITRFHMTLNPTNLGEVEVVLVNRGNNLHININSNNQTMQLFLQNQAEFKSSLVNMGFSELSMNFSDQKQKEEQNQNTKFKNYNEDFEDTLNPNEEKEQTILEVVLPRYF